MIRRRLWFIGIGATALTLIVFSLWLRRAAKELPPTLVRKSVAQFDVGGSNLFFTPAGLEGGMLTIHSLTTGQERQFSSDKTLLTPRPLIIRANPAGTQLLLKVDNLPPGNAVGNLTAPYFRPDHNFEGVYWWLVSVNHPTAPTPLSDMVTDAVWSNNQIVVTQAGRLLVLDTALKPIETLTSLPKSDTAIPGKTSDEIVVTRGGTSRIFYLPKTFSPPTEITLNDHQLYLRNADGLFTAVLPY